MTDGTITLRAFIRPGTPPSAPGSTLIPTIGELYRFGLLGPGSQVWVNFDLPQTMWILSDRSSLLRIVDVPLAGHVRMTSKYMAWSLSYDQAVKSKSNGTARSGARIPVERDAMPVTLGGGDLMTVAFRNADPVPMRAAVANGSKVMENYEYSCYGMRAVDFKVGDIYSREPLASPPESEVYQAHARGMDLLCATSETRLHRKIHENIEALTVRLDPDILDRVKAQQDRINTITENVLAPAMQTLVGMRGFSLSNRVAPLLPPPAAVLAGAGGESGAEYQGASAGTL